MIFKATCGAEIIEKIDINEIDALKKYPALNHALVIVKIDEDYLLGYHKWRELYRFLRLQHKHINNFFRNHFNHCYTSFQNWYCI